MRKGASKSKGSSFEREISRFLTKWASGQTEELYYWRSPSSGAVATLNVGNKDISGDIIALRPEGAFLTDRFSIEIKTGYSKASFHQHLKDNKNFDIENFWLQCVDAADRAGKKPMLIYRKLGFPIIVGIGCDTRIRLKEKMKLPKSVHLIFENKTPSIAFYDMKEFFKIITPNVIKEL
ncbi:MAG TPA: hypothetical protein P5293_01255 [Bacteroidales bacterium]|nr:hypothetical protein [Bacteroidales bacterium]